MELDAVENQEQVTETRLYKKWFKKQSGRCAICYTQPVGIPLILDVSKNTKQVRGLLCDRCNRGLAEFTHGVIKLQAAINYLCNEGPFNTKPPK